MSEQPKFTESEQHRRAAINALMPTGHPNGPERAQVYALLALAAAIEGDRTNPKRECPQCHGAPPEGFTCSMCDGRGWVR